MRDLDRSALHHSFIHDEGVTDRAEPGGSESTVEQKEIAGREHPMLRKSTAQIWDMDEQYSGRLHQHPYHIENTRLSTVAASQCSPRAYAQVRDTVQ